MLVESALTVLLAGVKVSALFPPAVTALVVVAALGTDSFPGLYARPSKAPGRSWGFFMMG